MSRKFSAINSGTSSVGQPSTDQLVMVRSGTTDLLMDPRTIGGQVGIIQQNQNAFGNVSTGQTLAYSSNVTAGSLLVGVVSGSNPGLTFTCSDGLNGSWTSAKVQTSGSLVNQIFYFANSLGGACTVTITPSTTTQLSFSILEVSGIVASSPLDAVVGNTGTSILVYPFALAVAKPGEFIVTAFSQVTANLSWCIDNSGGYVWTTLFNGSTGAGLVADARIGRFAPNDPGSQFSPSQSVAFAGCAAAFKVK